MKTRPISALDILIVVFFAGYLLMLICTQSGCVSNTSPTEPDAQNIPRCNADGGTDNGLPECSCGVLVCVGDDGNLQRMNACGPVPDGGCDH